MKKHFFKIVLALAAIVLGANVCNGQASKVVELVPHYELLSQSGEEKEADSVRKQIDKLLDSIEKGTKDIQGEDEKNKLFSELVEMPKTTLYSKKKAELVSYCKVFELKTSGTKKIVFDRLYNYLHPPEK